MLLSVYDDRCDLLVHEDEDGAQQCRDDGSDGRPRGVVAQGMNQPPAARPGGTEGLGDLLNHFQVFKLGWILSRY